MSVADQTEAPASPTESLPDTPVEAVTLPQPSAEDLAASRPEVDGPARPFPSEVSDSEPIKADPEKDAIERLLSQPAGPFELLSGTRVKIRPLKMRQFLSLLRIITRGAANSMGDLNFNFEDPDAFVQTFLAMVIFAIPETENETIQFVQQMVEPADATGNKDIDAAAAAALWEELDDPELEDIVNIIGAIIANEGADLQALGKRLRTMFSTAKKMGVLNAKKAA